MWFSKRLSICRPKLTFEQGMGAALNVLPILWGISTMLQEAGHKDESQGRPHFPPTLHFWAVAPRPCSQCPPEWVGSPTVLHCVLWGVCQCHNSGWQKSLAKAHVLCRCCFTSLPWTLREVTQQHSGLLAERWWSLVSLSGAPEVSQKSCKVK